MLFLCIVYVNRNKVKGTVKKKKKKKNNNSRNLDEKLSFSASILYHAFKVLTIYKKVYCSPNLKRTASCSRPSDLSNRTYNNVWLKYGSSRCKVGTHFFQFRLQEKWHCFCKFYSCFLGISETGNSLAFQ